MALNTTRTALALALERLLNDLAGMDLNIHARLHALQDRRIRVRVRPFPDALILEPGTPVRVLAADSGDCDATVTGTPLVLLSWLTREDAPEPDWEGDETLKPQLAGLFRTEQIDVQPVLARLSGDTPAELLAPLFNEAASVLQRSGTQLQEDLKEYLLNESGWFPHPEAVNALERDAHALAGRVDDLEARIEALMQSAGAGKK